MSRSLARYSNILQIVGDILKVRVPEHSGSAGFSVAFDDLAFVEDRGGFRSLARVIKLDREVVALQVFAGTKGLSNEASVQFLGYPMRVTYSTNILGRVFRGDGVPLDGGPDLSICAGRPWPSASRPKIC